MKTRISMRWRRCKYEDQSNLGSCVQHAILKKIKTKSFSQVDNPHIVIFIKPWDDEVYTNFIIMLQ